MTDQVMVPREELKPCPFCGGEATVMEVVNEFWVKCCECHSANGLSTGNRGRAIEAWNTRAALEAKPQEPVAWRWQVVAFANAMEERLRANDHKGHWDGCDKNWLLTRLIQESGELASEVYEVSDDDQIIHEAADVANFAMMVADVCGELKPVAPPAPADQAERIAELERENEQAKEAIATLSVGRPIGDIIGLQTARNALAYVGKLKSQPAAANKRIAELEASMAWYNGRHEEDDKIIADLESQLAAANEARKAAEKDAVRWIACCENTNLFIDAAFSESKSSRGKAVIDAHVDAVIAQGKEPSNG